MEYAERDIEELGDYYTRHVNAMTGESLNMKSQIAAELAHRDKTINELTAMVERLREAGQPFANYACSPKGECDCHNCKLQDVIEESPPQALNAIRAEVAGECAKICHDIGEDEEYGHMYATGAGECEDAIISYLHKYKEEG